ncbi:hypothetical protein OAD58_01395 [Gammaproteobacteria bacterium]|nr:hypothetical protein [Gammaproteobacteria bacterium]
MAMIITTSVISSCSYNSLKPEVVDRSSAQRMQTVVFATVVSVDRVVLAGDGDTGAIAGSALGAKAGDAATRKPAIELLLDLDSEKTVSIIQEEGDYAFAAGQRVKIIKNKGKSRVMPLK